MKSYQEDIILLQVTNAGIQAAAQAQSGGPKITITAFKVGSAYGYTPSVNATALTGTILYSGSPSNYAVNSENEVIYTLLMNELIGDFNFGEIGLYLEDGTLFAIGTYSTPQPKLHTTGQQVGNIVSIQAKIKLNNVSPVINFPINNIALAQILRVGGISLLVPPILSDSNAYFTGDYDDGGSMVYAFRSADYQWSYPSHSNIKVAGQVTSVDTGSDALVAAGKKIVSTNIGTSLSDLVTGRYIIQFITGPLKGYSRMISAQGANNCSWQAPLGAIPQVGDQFLIYQSNYSALKDIVEPATEGRAGIVELATAAEAQVGTDNTRAVTPAGLTAARPFEATAANIKMNGTQAVGSLATVARGDHVHPTDTSRAPLASPALTGVPTAPTAAQFDNDTSLATTEFVQRALGNFRSETAVNSSTTLNTAAIGQLIVGSTGTYTTTLPLANSVPAGACIWFEGTTGITTWLVQRQGTDIIDNNGGATFFSIGVGDTAVLESNGAGTWRIVGGSLSLKNAASFGSSLAGNGYQKLPGGLIIQWGQATGSSSGPVTVTYPVAFTSQTYRVLAATNAANLGFMVSVNTFTASGFNAETFSANASRSTNAFEWLAIGR